MSISDKDLPIKFIFVSVYLVRIIYIFDDVIIGVVVINEVFLGRYWFRLLILWWRWAKGQKIPEQLNMISIIMFRNLYWLSPSKVGYYSKNSVQKFSVQVNLCQKFCKRKSFWQRFICTKGQLISEGFFSPFHTPSFFFHFCTSL